MTERKEPPHKFHPILDFCLSKACLPSQELWESSPWLPTNTARIYNAKQKLRGCVSVCVRDRRRKKINENRKLLLPVWGDGLSKTAPMLKSPLVSVSNQSRLFFSFLLLFFQIIFLHKDAHSHTHLCIIFHYRMNGRRDGRTDGRIEVTGLRTTTRENVTLLWFVFCIFWGVIDEQCCFFPGTDRREKHMVLGVETRNKCLYVVSYELEAFESLYGVNSQMFLVTEKLKKKKN